ncbi:hypothetical protein Taro_053808 [Colocasia esculenta]|uniref:Uncharacterized protein n=1 Tax=Colocasia esculenta TaxID=4460 RepID=A0A843XNV5_COLES|nr:hypothetical protein [Colocasia esculenta]
MRSHTDTPSLKCNVSLDHVNPGRSNHTESAYHGDRMLCSTRRENSYPGIGIAYVSTIRNRHYETAVRTLGQNSTEELVY